MNIKVGTDIFQKYRERGYLYVDKTALVREVLNGSEVTLIPRPRRFGKTLNMTMLHSFFDKTQNSRALFEGLAITEDAEAMTHLNAHPTIFLSLKGLACASWSEMQFEMVQCLVDVVDQQQSLLDLSQLTASKRERIEAALAGKSPLTELGSFLRVFSEALFKSTGEKVILLIDEYDAPIHAGLENGYYDEVIKFFRVFLGEGLKGNPYLERAVLTGILRIAKESIFSGLNNLDVHTVLDTPFSTCFGFTEAEVQTLLDLTQSPHPMSEVRDWYNGYRFGETIIYNPWSILNMLARPELPLIRYWLNTSGNELIRDLIQSGEACTLAELDVLLSGEAVRKEINSLVTIRERKPSSAWSLMLFSGYLTARAYDPRTRMAELVIPNREVYEFYDDTVRDWLGLQGKATTMLTYLLEGQLDLFATELAEVVVTTLSYHDTAKPYPEQVFHVFVLGVLVQLSQDYQLLSNRETGHGRGDLQLIPKKPGRPGFLFEFKAANSAQAEVMRNAAQAALGQAFERDYTAHFRQAGVVTLYTLGLASYGKRLALASVLQTLPDGAPSEIAYHLGRKEPEPAAPAEAIEVSRSVNPSVALRLQMLQQSRGMPITPLEVLMGFTADDLDKMIQTLSAP